MGVNPDIPNIFCNILQTLFTSPVFEIFESADFPLLTLCVILDVSVPPEMTTSGPKTDPPQIRSLLTRVVIDLERAR